MLNQDILVKLYKNESKSSAEIAHILNCSVSQVNYWLKKYEIKKRSISDATYIKNNKNGDPFHEKEITIDNDSFLVGIGIGLYWGEGTKANKNSIRLGNTDPYLIKQFIVFLQNIFNVDKSQLKFGLQLFNDIEETVAKRFWIKTLDIKHGQFYKTTITKSVSQGTYKKKTQYGVITLYFNNTKLRNILNHKLEKIKKVV